MFYPRTTCGYANLAPPNFFSVFFWCVSLTLLVSAKDTAVQAAARSSQAPSFSLVSPACLQHSSVLNKIELSAARFPVKCTPAEPPECLTLFVLSDGT